MNVGDRVREQSRASNHYSIEGTIVALPGMAVYDRGNYHCARDGCVWVSDSGNKYWSFRDSLRVILPKTPNWEI